MKCTNVFPANIYPVRKGVYNVSGYGGMGNFEYSYWDGEYWSISKHSPEMAKVAKGNISRDQKRQWRGILKD